MSTPYPCLMDFDAMMKAAEQMNQISSLQDEYEQNKNEDVNTSSVTSSLDDKGTRDEINLDLLGTVKTTNNIKEDIKEEIKETIKVKEDVPNIAGVLNELASNPNQLNKMIEESMGQITPEVMEQARKLAMGGQGDQIMREMQKRGIDVNSMNANIRQLRNALPSVKKTGLTKTIVYVTRSRQIKEKDISMTDPHSCIATILRTTTPIELSCSRLAQGPLFGQSIKVWYNPADSSKNRLASKITGFPVGGELLIVSESTNLCIADVNTVLKTYLE